jgi:hypothetical protein
MTAAHDHVETCASLNCHFFGRQSEMVKASKVSINPRARGWYCTVCAESKARLLKAKNHDNSTR